MSRSYRHSKTRRSTIHRWALPLLLAALYVVGCGGDADSGDETVDPTTRAGDSETVAPTEPSPTEPPQRFDPEEEVEIEPPSETTVPDEDDRERAVGEGSSAADELERARAEERAQRANQLDTEDID